MKYLIVCSSSGGHIYPGLYFGSYLKKCGEEVNYLGIKNQIEEKIIKSDLYVFDIPKSFKVALKNPFKFIYQRKIVNEFVNKYDVIVGFGGFISYFVSILPCIKNKKFYLHEANVDIGDSNLFSLKRCRFLFTSFRNTKNRKYKNKIIYVGNPVTDEISKSRLKEFICFIFGSLGSKTLLDKVSDYLLNKNDNEKYILVTGEKYYEEYYHKLKDISNLKVISFIDKKYLYQHCKLIFCRGGASTLMEVMKANINCVCIPSPYVKHNHQFNNAEVLSSYHCLVLIEENKFNNQSIKECLNLYKSKYSVDELKNQKYFVKDNVSLNMYLRIKNDINK